MSTPSDFEPSAPFGVPRPFLSRDIVAQVATEAWQRAAYFELRREIFEREQGLFSDSDVDEHDGRAVPIVASSQVLGMADEVVGVVRIYPTAEDTWYGGRLGVSDRYRRVGAVGGALIHCAVTTAHALGCRRFLATVQSRNVRYFEHYAFRSLEEIHVRGRPHHLMQADLACFPPCQKALGLITARAA
jgi:putative N-acetyltransferase (TIGR04045 family)